MTKTRLFLSVVTASATVAALAYAFNRRTQQPAVACLPGAPADEVASAIVPPQVSIGMPASAASVAAHLHAVVTRIASDEVPTPTVQCTVRMPSPIGADDTQALEPDEIGADWLSRATQSERSLSEADLDVDLENIAEVLDESEPLDEDFAEAEI